MQKRAPETDRVARPARSAQFQFPMVFLGKWRSLQRCAPEGTFGRRSDSPSLAGAASSMAEYSKRVAPYPRNRAAVSL